MKMATLGLVAAITLVGLLSYSIRDTKRKREYLFCTANARADYDARIDLLEYQRDNHLIADADSITSDSYIDFLFTKANNKCHE